MSIRLILAYVFMALSMMGFYFSKTPLGFPNFMLVYVPAFLSFLFTTKKFSAKVLWLMFAVISFLTFSALGSIFSIMHWPVENLFRFLMVLSLIFLVGVGIYWAVEQKEKNQVFAVHLFLFFGFVFTILVQMVGFKLSNLIWSITILSYVLTLVHLNDFHRWETNKKKEEKEQEITF